MHKKKPDYVICLFVFFFLLKTRRVHVVSVATTLNNVVTHFYLCLKKTIAAAFMAHKDANTLCEVDTESLKDIENVLEKNKNMMLYVWHLWDTHHRLLIIDSYFISEDEGIIISDSKSI